MKLVTHGGKCCGVKIIHRLQNYPDALTDAVPKRETPWAQPCHGGWEYENAGEDFFHGEAPVETYLERFKRLIEYCQTERPKGMIEVTINGGQVAWKPILADRGFKLVTSFKNSNSSNIVHVYHLVYGQE